MASINRGAVIASMFMLMALIISACKTPYSTPPPSTPTTGPLFQTPMTPDITMSDVANFGTSTALALTGTPQVVATQTISVSTQDPNASLTPTALASANPAATSTLASVSTPATAAPAGPRPTEWTLRSGEFPYCIARRFDVDPSTLLSLNGLTNGNIYYPGRTLKIPQSGSFPGDRSLLNHPAPYTVRSSSETIYSIACLFGDVRPEAITQVNNLSGDNPTLTSGQSLNIP